MKRMYLLLALWTLLGVAMAQDNADVQRLMDEQAIIKTVNAIGLYADFDQWDRVAEQFADEVILDYTSYESASAGTEGGNPETLTPQDVVAAWQTVLPGYDHTQHVIGNHQVEVTGDEATVVSTIHATHILENDTGENYWIFIGDYEHHLIRTEAGWKVDHMTANMRSQLGNPNLSQLATERVAAQAQSQ
jgi:hypothetical protein